jgi:ATP-dependent protease ClpP protease subunit
MDVIKPDIATIALGQCASTATLLLVRALARCLSDGLHSSACNVER